MLNHFLNSLEGFGKRGFDLSLSAPCEKRTSFHLTHACGRAVSSHSLLGNIWEEVYTLLLRGRKLFSAATHHNPQLDNKQTVCVNPLNGPAWF